MDWMMHLGEGNAHAMSLKEISMSPRHCLSRWFPVADLQLDIQRYYIIETKIIVHCEDESYDAASLTKHPLETLTA